VSGANRASFGRLVVSRQRLVAGETSSTIEGDVREVHEQRATCKKETATLC
jgi:hypothetical protein